MKHFIVIITAALAMCTQAVYAQPAVLNSTGGSATVGGNTYEWSVGELVVHTVSTPSVVVTQGLLQPMPPGVSVGNVKSIAADVQVYPNPAKDVLILQPALVAGTILLYTLQDITGRVIYKAEVQLHTGQEKQSISISTLTPGNYILQVQAQQPGDIAHASFKIYKQN
jgi:hypothetical protein